MPDLKICGGAYEIEAPISIQDCINLYPEVEYEGSQNRIVLRRFPGLKLFSTPSVGNRIRGQQNMAGTLYVVAGTTFYSVNEAGTATSIGTIAGTDLVSMATDGTNVVIVNGTATGYVYNGTSLSTISDADFVTADIVFFLDTYFVFHKTDTAQFFISNTGSATAYTATDIATKEGQPGNIITMMVAHRDLILIGEKTMETWRNTGNTDFTFERQNGTFQERGAIGSRCPIEMDNSIYFLGDDRVVYTREGYLPVRISNHAIETWLSEQTQSTLDDAIGMTITHQGHYWYILSFAMGTWIYDATTSVLMGRREWFQLQSLDKLNWRVTSVETAYGRTLCGDDDGNIYELDPLTLNENGNRQLKQRTAPYYHNDRAPISCHRLELAFKQGVANSNVTDPQVLCEISRDWGRTWGSRRARSMGKLGEYIQKAVWRRNGYARGFVFRWFVTDDVDVTFTGGYGDFGSGSG